MDFKFEKEESRVHNLFYFFNLFQVIKILDGQAKIIQRQMRNYLNVLKVNLEYICIATLGTLEYIRYLLWIHKKKLLTKFLLAIPNNFQAELDN